MRAADRILAALGAAVLVLLLAGAGTAAWLAYGYGTVEVNVRSDEPGGSEIALKLPGALVRIAAAFLPADVLRESGREAAKWLPVARVALSELRRCPDARLVDVKSRGETVRITKLGDTLLAEIHSERETIRVAIPLRAACAAMEAFAVPPGPSAVDAR